MYEFRKRKPRQSIDKIFVYECCPSRRIPGWFRFKAVHSGTPDAIWEQCKDRGGIKEECYLAYCRGKKMIYAFEINEVFRFEAPMNPFDAFVDFRPPQDFMYFSGDMAADSI